MGRCTRLAAPATRDARRATSTPALACVVLEEGGGHHADRRYSTTSKLAQYLKVNMGR